jgi:hypothetical protein
MWMGEMRVYGTDDSNDYLVWLPPRTASMTDFLADLCLSADIGTDQVYRTWPGGFGARLTSAQAAAVRQLTGGDVQPDDEGRPAPYAQHGAAGRVPGSYVVTLAGRADAAAVAARNGVHPTASWKRVFVGFSARMNDQQLQRLRHDPDVALVQDNVRMTAD